MYEFILPQINRTVTVLGVGRRKFWTESSRGEKSEEAELYDCWITRKTLEALKNDEYMATDPGDGTAAPAEEKSF